MYKYISLLLLSFSFVVQAQTISTLQFGVAGYDQEQKKRFKVYPLGLSFLVSLEKSLKPLVPLYYGVYFGMDSLSSDIMADGLENKLSQRNTNYGVWAKYSMVRKLALIFGLGYSSVNNKLETAVTNQEQTAYFRLFDLKNSERSKVGTLGVQYTFGDRRRRDNTFINFTRTKFKKFDATLYTLSIGFSWEMARRRN